MSRAGSLFHAIALLRQYACEILKVLPIHPAEGAVACQLDAWRLDVSGRMFGRGELGARGVGTTDRVFCGAWGPRSVAAVQ